MRTRSIIVNAHEAPALHSGEQTLILRPMKPQPPVDIDRLVIARGLPQMSDGDTLVGMCGDKIRLPVYLGFLPYLPGDILAVRETWGMDIDGGIYYKASFADSDWPREFQRFGPFWRSPATMPAWAVRTRLEVVEVRAMMVGELTREDCIAAGCPDKAWFCVTGGPEHWFKTTWQYRYGPKALSWETAWAWAVRVKGA